MSTSALKSKAVYIVATKRTAFGTFGGTLKDVTAPLLGAAAAKGALAQLGPDAAGKVDSVIVGNVAQTTSDCSYMARHVGLKAGVPIDRPMLTVNRLCGSGFQAMVNGAQEILLGDANVVLTGGAESMSSAPYTLHGTRWGSPLGVNLNLVDSLWESLTDKHVNCTMSMTAENLAEKYKVNKEQADKWAAESQKRFAAAAAAGVFKNEIVPYQVKGKKGEMINFEVDEHPRPSSTVESLSKLRALFKKDGVVSAGNASGICDGAGAVVLASEAAVKANGWKPLARIVSYAAVGVPPEIMGLGPVPAYQLALKRAGLEVKDMDLCEINEAFAAQFVVCMNELGLDPSKTNVNGGAVAIGHPTGASGARIMGHLALELNRKGLKRAIGGACIGGGQGIAVVIERP